ncbi:MAG: hypothetical protein LBU60_02600 [Clostridiales bacterium]|jgi:hypothetical protein|nr:hypothetical protein [Clostridiales bacterium]
MTDFEKSKPELGMSAKRRSICTKLIVFMLALVLPVSTVMMASLQTRYAVLPAVDMQTQIERNHQRMHETNLAHLVDLQNEYSSQSSLARFSQEDAQVDEMFALGFTVLDMLQADMDTQEVFDYFFGNLSPELQQQMTSMLQGLFVSGDSSQSSDATDSVTSRGWYNTHLVIAMDIGYATGTLVGWLIGVVIGAHLSTVLAWLEIAGLIGAAVLGAIVGAFVEVL